MSAEQYTQYVTAHNHWVENVHRLDNTLHEKALVRRFLENKTESLRYQTEGNPIKNLDLGSRYTLPGGKSAYITATIQAKKEHAPLVSTKPHQAEKRAEKVLLRNERTAAKVKVVKARIEVAKSTLVEEVKHRLQATRQIRAALPLWKLEEQAAKSAAKRVKAIHLASSTQTADVSPDDGWKIVTRKKGKELVPNSEVRHYGADSKLLSSHLFSQDPQGAKTASIIQAVRKPTSLTCDK
jgi:hypothetical protein